MQTFNKTVYADLYATLVAAMHFTADDTDDIAIDASNAAMDAAYLACVAYIDACAPIKIRTHIVRVTYNNYLADADLIDNYAVLETIESFYIEILKVAALSGKVATSQLGSFVRLLSITI